MIALRAILYGGSIAKQSDRRVIVEVGPPGRDGVDCLVVDPWGSLYWCAGSSMQIVGVQPNGGGIRDWLDPQGATLPEDG